MIALVIGQGSIGSRHSAVLKGMKVPTVAVSRRGRSDFQSLGAALEDRPEIGYVVVANETHLHIATLRSLVAAGFEGPVLVEKPLSHSSIGIGNGYEGLQLKVGYNLRYNPGIQWLKDWSSVNRPLSLQLRAGQDLRQWRPGRDISTTSSAMQGVGGVLRDFSHEFDYLLWIFGQWKRLVATGGLVSDLPIESEDVCHVLIEFQSGMVASLELNYLDRIATRKIEINSSTGTVSVDLLSGSIVQDGAEIDDLITVDRNETYELMHREVMSNPLDGIACTPVEATRVVRMIEAIELSVAKSEWISS